jgi:glucose-1-phosphate thymidylyltransferase
LKGLVLAGGHGTRLRPLTYTGNKHMLPIANKPMLLYGLEHLRNAGIEEVGIILGPIKEGIREVVGDGSALGLKVTYIDQPDPLGLAHAVIMAESFLAGDPFVMYLGDNLLRDGVAKFRRTFEAKEAACVIGVTKVSDPSRYGVVVMKDGRPSRLVEKPKVPPSDLALIGVYVFGPSIFSAAKSIKPSWRNELEITDAIQVLVSRGEKVEVEEVEGWWKDTGTVSDMLEANRLVLDDLKAGMLGTVEDTSAVHGRIASGRTSVIHRGATVMGPCVLGENVDLAAGVRIGPFTSLGDNVVVKKGEIENSIVMEGCTIDSDERIVDSLIGPRSTITSRPSNEPRGKKLIIGERSTVEF